MNCDKGFPNKSPRVVILEVGISIFWNFNNKNKNLEKLLFKNYG